MLKFNDKLKFLVYHGVISSIIIIYFHESISFDFLKTKILFALALLTFEFIYYEKIKAFCKKYESSVGVLVVATVLFIVFAYVALLLPFWLYYNITFILVIMCFLTIDLLLFGVNFGIEYKTIFERIFIYFLLFVSIISLYSFFSEKLSVEITKYGNQATLLSFAFGFILYYISEFSNRKERLNKNTNESELERKTNEIANLKKQIVYLNRIIELNKSQTAMDKKIKTMEGNLEKIIETKTAQIIKKIK